MEAPNAGNFLCICHFGGEVVTLIDSLNYEGGQAVGVSITKDTTFAEFIQIFCAQAMMHSIELSFMYTTKYLPTQLLPLNTDRGMRDLVSFNDNYAHVYVHGERVQNIMPTHISEQMSRCEMDSIASASTPSEHLSEHLTDGVPTSTIGYMSRCAVNQSGPLESTVWGNALHSTGQTFASAEEFRKILYKFSLAHNFRYKWTRNAPNALSTYCAVEGCPWQIKARAIRSTPIVRVTTFNNVHSHNAQDLITMAPMSKAKGIAAILEDEVRQDPDLTPPKIRSEVKRKYGMNVSYKQAWRAKEKTKMNIRGDVSHTYKLLPWLCNRLKDSNPGTIAEWTCDADLNFKQLFIAYGCSINGFLLGCRPIIAVDSSFLSGPYRGALYSATAFNADDEMYPLAFGILSSENYEDWLWFLQHLKGLIGSVKVTIISDRHNALLESVGEVFGIENHSHCFTHLKENFGKQATRKNMGGKKGKEDALRLLNAVAYARMEEDYDIAMANLASFSSHLSKWVEETGPEHWAMSKFPNKRWDKITSNLAESFNSWVRKERHHSVIDFVHEHRNKLGTLLHKHAEEMKNWKQPVGPNIEKKLLENISRSLSTVVYPYMSNKFLVKTGNADISVDLLARECTCQYWQMSGIPCEHACAAIRSMGDKVYSYVDECYLVSTQQRIYNDGLKPVNTHDMPSIDSDGNVQYNVDDCTLVSLDPPTTRRPAGRPRERRIESNHIKKRPLHCSLCLEEGHNRGTCKNPNPGAQR